MNAIVQYRNQYGTEVVYPVNDVATRFAEIAQTKVLTKPTIALMKALGVSFEVVQEARTV
jgi:hypothetical protein